MTRYKQTFTQFDEHGEIFNIKNSYLEENEFKLSLQADVKFAKTTTEKVRLSYYYEGEIFQGYALTNYSIGYNRLIIKE